MRYLRKKLRLRGHMDVQPRDLIGTIQVERIERDWYLVTDLATGLVHLETPPSMERRLGGLGYVVRRLIRTLSSEGEVE